jgi:predicted small secreted protein
MEPHMKRVMTLLTLCALTALMGCNTVKGLGEDVQKAGSAIENAAKK